MEVNNSLAAGQTTTSTSSKKSLSVDDFLQIMAAEISNQNPMGSEGGSGSNTDYISQLAQFTSLEQMSGISDSLTLLTLMNQQQYSFSLIGKEVTLTDGEESITGIVDKIKFEDGYAMLQVNGKSYHLGAVTEVGSSKAIEE